ncbi:helix-turn-helix domain-containing protein [Spirosoma areae]
MLFQKRVAAGLPRFALITNENLENPALFTNIRAISSGTSIIVCLTSESVLTKSLWAVLDNLEFDVLCTVDELTDCLLTLKAGRFYHSSLLQTHSGYELTETFPGWHDLTPAERRVLKLMVEGSTGPQIAAALFISAKTVNNHKAKISQKLNVTGGPGSLTRFVLMEREQITALLA